MDKSEENEIINGVPVRMNGRRVIFINVYDEHTGDLIPFLPDKTLWALHAAFKATGKEDKTEEVYDLIARELSDPIYTEQIGKTALAGLIKRNLMKVDQDAAEAYIRYEAHHREIKKYVREKIEFIEQYKKTSNNADATIDDNSNVVTSSIANINAEIHKTDNLELNRAMVMDKLQILYPDFDKKQYIKDLESHIIYKHDESGMSGAIAPYCVSVSMYPMLTGEISKLGGPWKTPKNLNAFCGIYINMVFAIAAQFLGAVATPEFFVYFDYFARKEFGEDYAEHLCNPYTEKKNIGETIDQYFQQVVYSINQPASARGMQSAFVNFSIFDRAFFAGMFSDFRFPDGTASSYSSVSVLQDHFLSWFNAERLKCMLTFPVVSVAMVCKDGKFADEDMKETVAEEYAKGNSFFTYISDTVDSLSSCCRLKNKVQTHEFNFTNGNMGVETGSKSVITLNLNRIMQDFAKTKGPTVRLDDTFYDDLRKYLGGILGRVYKYHTAYNENLKDMLTCGKLPVYSAGFIDLKKQYMTIGLNGLNEAAEFMGIVCNDNEQYKRFCNEIFGIIKDSNTAAKTKELTFNTEMVPAESLAIKNYNWDKDDGYWVPADRNLYASYIYKPSDAKLNILDKLKLHGSGYIGDWLDGGAAAHINLDSHLSKEQYLHILDTAARDGCQYFTFNVPNSECQDCGFITKHPICECPECHSKNIVYYDRVIGYLTKISNWSAGRRKEQKTRVYSSDVDDTK